MAPPQHKNAGAHAASVLTMMLRCCACLRDCPRSHFLKPTSLHAAGKCIIRRMPRHIPSVLPAPIHAVVYLRPCLAMWMAIIAFSAPRGAHATAAAVVPEPEFAATRVTEHKTWQGLLSTLVRHCIGGYAYYTRVPSGLRYLQSFVLWPLAPVWMAMQHPPTTVHLPGKTDPNNSALLLDIVYLQYHHLRLPRPRCRTAARSVLCVPQPSQAATKSRVQQFHST